MTAPAFQSGDRIVVEILPAPSGSSPDRFSWAWATVIGNYPIGHDGTVRVEFDDAQRSRASLPVDRCYHSSTAVAAPIVLEVMAQLESLSDETCAHLSAVASWNPEREAALLALAEDLRETLIATLDVRVADWCADNAGGIS